MITNHQLVEAARTFIGQPYSTDPGRDDPDSGHKDCSGLIAASYELAYRNIGIEGERLGANISVTIFDLAARHGLVISYYEALGIEGACLLRPEDPYQGWGPKGHIAFSDGYGGTVEATPPRVQALSVDYNAPWSSMACLLPNVNYGQNPTTTTWSEDMIYYGEENGQTVGLAMQGNVIVATFTQPSTNPYGIPDDAVEYSNGAIPIRLTHPLVLAKLRRADEVACPPRP